MRLKSEMVSTILKIMLVALVALTASELIATIIFTVDNSFYMDKIYSINNFINSVSTMLYYMIVAIYLIWIYRVHLDLKVSFLNYPRSPGSALACSMIPLFSFYGLPSTYLMIGQHFQHETTGIEKQGSRISGLSIPLILCFIVVLVMNRLLTNAGPDETTTLLVISAIVRLGMYLIFLALCTLVTTGLKLHNSNKEREHLDDFNHSISNGAAM